MRVRRQQLSTTWPKVDDEDGVNIEQHDASEDGLREIELHVERF